MQLKSIYLLIGGPGSGKTSTMEAMNAKEVSHYSVGAMYRKIAEKQTELGNQVKSYVDNGQIVPLTIAQKVIEHCIEEGKPTIVIDGFPRNMQQAKMFNNAIHNKAELCGVIELTVDEKEALKRITLRARGTDDAPELFKDRMDVYNNEIEEIRKYYTSQNKYITVESKSRMSETVAELSRILTLENHG